MVVKENPNRKKNVNMSVFFYFTKKTSAKSFFSKTLKGRHFLLSGGKNENRKYYFWLVFGFFGAIYKKCRFAPLVKIRQKL